MARSRFAPWVTALLSAGFCAGFCLSATADPRAARIRVAKTLTREISHSVARIRQLPLRRPLKVAVYDADALRAFLLRQIDSHGGARHLARLGRALQRFGLVPPTVSLRAAYVALLQDQVAGLYDPVAGELRVMAKLVPVGVQLPNPLHLLTGSPEEQLRFVMAHEIVHALQDQRWNLRRLSKDRRGETDLETALSSLFEGDATLGALLWAMDDRSGHVDLRSLLAAAPAIQRLMTGALALAKVGLLPGGAGLSAAPVFLQERLVVPYTAGLALCMAAAARRRPRSDARSGARSGRVLGLRGVDALYDHPPLSMEQVLHPEKMWRKKPDYPVILRLPRLRRLVGNHAKVVHRDDLGELYIRRLLRGAMPEAEADAAAAGWGGDRYMALKTRRGPALVWLTTWDSVDDAVAFEAAATTWLRGLPDADRTRDGMVQRGADVLVWRGLSKARAKRVRRRIFARVKRSVRRRLPR